MDFVGLTITALKTLADIVGNWGVAIIILTVIVRLLMWPSSVSQQRSMRVMQNLQPKMKAIQDRYKSDPQTMQRKMMEFYKEHKFNPMGGCLPVLIQIPIFILLYSALISPQFIQQAGQASFLFIDRLDATIKSNAGVSFDGAFQVDGNDVFATGKHAKVYFKNGEVEDSVKIEQPMKAVIVQGGVTPAEPVDLKIPLDNLNLKFAQLDAISKADIEISNTKTREIEKITFVREGNNLTASVPSIAAKNAIHYDVIFLVLLFAVTMWLTQKIMMAQQKNTQMDPTQLAIQKSMGTMMPIMILVSFVIIPIPAGVLLYLVTSNIFQIVQTVIINKKFDKEDEQKKDAIAQKVSDKKNNKNVENVIENEAQIIEAELVEVKEEKNTD